MAKKRARENQLVEEDASQESPGMAQMQLGDWLEQVPEEVQAAADERMRTLRAKNKANEKYNSASDACIEAMKKAGISRIRIDDGKKWLVCEDKPKLKTEKIKSPSEEE